ncbi:uncharacterized protein LOC104898529 [Beta vulgaris subsp. vulgaris]|uniref:uncharacterized protein LOC104898529 n=1 Tax=Beta vulgaris subsp. vulgaris TaxID=3555 RepID=UPI0020366997|nr:uncharacterized protein LOC104898529 [Beta vulgaris subsp. vulgaris]
MEGSGFSGRMYSNTGVGMLGLEIPLNQQQQQQQQQQQSQQQQQQQQQQSQQQQQHLQKHPHMVAFTNNHHKQHQQHEQQTQLSMKQPSNYLSSYNNPNSNPNTNPTQNQNPGLKIKTQMTHLTNSDEDEPGCANDHENSSVDDKRKGGTNVSPWHRMKWTDNMVRLLIMAVYYIGDEGGVEIGSEKKKPGSGGGGGGGGGGLLQKKGKWKSVSRAMMEKGFYVSPQQCEDKFNDLNKRYKRVNDILGKGTACRVVENQTLLDSMDVTPKLKEEVRKLLNSKHLFFREMCAYHNSCGHGAGGHGSDPGAAAAAAAVTVAEQPQLQHIQQNNTLHHHQMPMPKQQQQSCSHSATMSRSSMDPNSSHKLGLGLEDHDEDDDDDDEDDEDEYYEEDEEQDEGGQRKKAKTVVGDSSNNNNNSHALQKLNGEIMGMLQDGSKSSREKKQWMMTQLVQLEEQGLKFQFQALELEKQRWRWIKFSSKKEREMEKMKIDNERKRLETERMMLLLRQKEMEVLVEPSNPSCVSS